MREFRLYLTEEQAEIVALACKSLYTSNEDLKNIATDVGLVIEQELDVQNGRAPWGLLPRSKRPLPCIQLFEPDDFK